MACAQVCHKPRRHKQSTCPTGDSSRDRRVFRQGVVCSTIRDSLESLNSALFTRESHSDAPAWEAATAAGANQAAATFSRHKPSSRQQCASATRTSLCTPYSPAARNGAAGHM